MKAVARLNPFGSDGTLVLDVTPGQSLAQIARHEKLPEWFHQHCAIRVARHGRWVKYGPAMWPHVRPKPGALVELTPALEGGKASQIFIALAAVAFTFLTAGAGTGLAAAVGIGGQLLSGLLAKKARPESPRASKELKTAGVSFNDIERGSPVKAVLGKMQFSAQHLAPPFVTMENGRLWAHVLVGCWGRCLIENVLINGSAIADFSEVQYEIREGSGAEELTFLSNYTYLMDPIVRGMELRGFQVEDANLADQITPANSKPQWLVMRTNGVADEALIRLLFPAGLVDNLGVGLGMAFRLEIRLVGTSTWLKLPVLHARDSKLAGPFRLAIDLIWGKRSGRWVALQSNKPHGRGARFETGTGQFFEYNAETYFDPDAITLTDLLPVMSSNTSGSVTTSASSNSADAWKAADNSSGTNWSSGASALPAWWQIDWGSGNEKIIRSFLFANALSYNPTSYDFIASQTAPANMDDWDVLYSAKTYPIGMGAIFQIVNLANETSYRFYRFRIYSNHGAANNEVRFSELSFYSKNKSFTDENEASQRLANYVNCSDGGFEIFLDPNQGWTRGEYEIRLMRSGSYADGDLSMSESAYNYSGSAASAYFFDGDNVAPYSTIINQDDNNATVQLEQFTTVQYEAPIAPSVEAKLARIAVRVPDTEINSVSATFTSYGREWNGSIWTDEPVPTRNPAALWRDALLLRDRNADPLPGEILDESSMQAFFEWCDSQGFTSDAVVEDRSIADILALLASTARAAPRQSDMWGVVIDKDRTAEPITGLLTADTSRDEGTEIVYDNLPHALRASYLDEDENYQQKEVTAFRAGYSAANASDYLARDFDGTTSAAKAQARAEYELAEMTLRNIVYKRVVGFEGRFHALGDKIGIADEVLSRYSYWGLIKAVKTSGGNVIGFTLYGRVKLSESSDAVGMSGDVTGISDVSAMTGSFGVVVRRKDGTTFTAAITEKYDTSTVTLATPVADTGQFGTEQPIAVGPLGREVINTILGNKEYLGGDEWRLYLLPEAPAIHA